MVKTLKGKITLVYICLVIIIAVIGSASVLNLYRLSKSIDGLMVDNYKSINAISYMMEAFERQDSAALIYINVDIEKGIKLFTQNSNEFIKWYNTESNNITELGEKELLDSVNKDYNDYSMLFSELQEIRNKEGVNKSAYFYDTVMMPKFEKIKDELRQLTHLNEVSMFDAKDDATKSTHESMYVILTLSALAVIGGLMLSIHFTNRFMKPLDTLTKIIKNGIIAKLGATSYDLPECDILVCTPLPLERLDLAVWRGKMESTNQHYYEGRNWRPFRRVQQNDKKTSSI